VRRSRRRAMKCFPPGIVKTPDLPGLDEVVAGRGLPAREGPCGLTAPHGRRDLAAVTLYAKERHEQPKAVEHLELLLGRGKTALSRFPDESGRQERPQLSEGVRQADEVER
jgi:hypothetical protein